ncbi:MAG: ABC transporter permease [Bacteroidales bacterium]|nr:ABC transporter permease [Bacteroidales bacterium]
MEKFTTEIKPKDKLFDLELKQVWEKRYLLWLFIKRDLTVKFKQTIFGFAWYFISPLISTFIYIIVFSRVAGIPTDGIPQPLFYLSGTCLWNYFSQCIGKTSTTFQENSGLFGKVYFPRLISPISEVVSHLFRFFIQLSLFVIVYLIFVIKGADVHPNWYLLLFPVLVVMLGGIALGLGLIVTSLTTKYRDLKNFFSVFVSLWMYATPIVYPLSVIENQKLKTIMTLNPLTPITEAFKYGSMGAGEFSWGWLAYSFAVMLVLLVVGMLMFNRKQKMFIDTI